MVCPTYSLNTHFLTHFEVGHTHFELLGLASLIKIVAIMPDFYCLLKGLRLGCYDINALLRSVYCREAMKFEVQELPALYWIAIIW